MGDLVHFLRISHDNEIKEEFGLPFLDCIFMLCSSTSNTTHFNIG